MVTFIIRRDLHALPISELPVFYHPSVLVLNKLVSSVSTLIRQLYYALQIGCRVCALMQGGDKPWWTVRESHTSVRKY